MWLLNQVESPQKWSCQRLPHFILQAFCHCQKGTLAVTVDGDYDEWVRLTMTNILGNLVRVKKHGYNPPRNVNWLSILEPAAEIIASHFRYLRLMWLDLFRSFHNSHHHFAKTYIKSVIYFPGSEGREPYCENSTIQVQTLRLEVRQVRVTNCTKATPVTQWIFWGKPNL